MLLTSHANTATIETMAPKRLHASVTREPRTLGKATATSTYAMKAPKGKQMRGVDTPAAYGASAKSATVKKR
jgi:hypothetical protein